MSIPVKIPAKMKIPAGTGTGIPALILAGIPAMPVSRSISGGSVYFLWYPGELKKTYRVIWRSLFNIIFQNFVKSESRIY